MVFFQTIHPLQLSHIRALGIRPCVKVKRRKNAEKNFAYYTEFTQTQFIAVKLKEKLVTDVIELRIERKKRYLSPHDGPSQSGDYRLYDGTTPNVQLGFSNAER